MAEQGGRFPWKVQTLFGRGSVADSQNTGNPLPPPPSAGQKESVPAAVAIDVVVDGADQFPPKHPPKRVVEEPDDGSLVAVEDHGEEDSIDEDGDDDWEEVKGAGSVRSLSSHASQSISSLASGGGYKIQRTHSSSSTIDSSNNDVSSCDRIVDPSGKGVLGVDYVEHVVLPSDTFLGICIAYKVDPTRLRQANHFSGSSLVLAPKKLVIPVSKKALRSGFLRVQDTASKEYRVHALQTEFPDLSITEAKAYLELSDWNLNEAIQSAKEDNEWERDVDSAALPAKSLQPGQIRLTVKKKGVFACTLRGAGISRNSSSTTDDAQKEDTKGGKPADASSAKYEKKKIMVHDLPSIATKSVKPQDVYRAAPQHESFGVELQSLTKPLLTNSKLE